MPEIQSGETSLPGAEPPASEPAIPVESQTAPARAGFNPDYLLVGLFAALAHGFILLSDGIAWDDWLWINPADRSVNVARLVAAGREMGTVPLHAVYISLIRLVDYRVLVFCSVLTTAMLLYRIGRKSGLVSRAEAVFIAAISVVYPAYQTWPLMSTANYVFYYAIFLLGVLFVLEYETATRRGRWLLRAAALLGFLVSFGLNSLLAFYFGFLLFWLVWAQRRDGLGIGRTLVRLLTRRPDFVLLPIVYWVVKTLAFRTHGLYADYNGLSLSPARFLQTEGFLSHAVVRQLAAAVMLPVHEPVVGIFMLLLACLTYAVAGKRGPAFLEDTSRRPALLAFGIVLLFLGVIPYAVVGKGPTFDTSQGAFDHPVESTRHALLILMPVALILVGAFRLAFAWGKSRISALGLALLAPLTIVFTLQTVAGYVSWQARWVKDRAAMADLDAPAALKTASIYWVYDSTDIGVPDKYNFYEWTSMLKLAWGGESRLGIDVRLNPPESGVLGYLDSVGLLTWRYNLSEFDPKGPQARIVLRRGSAPGRDRDLVLRYLYYRFLRPTGMQDFLESVTRIEFIPGAPPN
jgi:hypothetical protein